MSLAEQMAQQPLLWENEQVILLGSDFIGRASGVSQCLTPALPPWLVSVWPSLRGLSQFVP